MILNVDFLVHRKGNVMHVFDPTTPGHVVLKTISVCQNSGACIGLPPLEVGTWVGCLGIPEFGSDGTTKMNFNHQALRHANARVICHRKKIYIVPSDMISQHEYPAKNHLWIVDRTKILSDAFRCFPVGEKHTQDVSNTISFDQIADCFCCSTANFLRELAKIKEDFIFAKDRLGWFLPLSDLARYKQLQLS